MKSTSALHALDRHGVVDRGAHAADRAVALQLDQAALLGALEEGLVERGILQGEGTFISERLSFATGES